MCNNTHTTRRWGTGEAQTDLICSDLIEAWTILIQQLPPRTPCSSRAAAAAAAARNRRSSDIGLESFDDFLFPDRCSYVAIGVPGRVGHPAVGAGLGIQQTKTVPGRIGHPTGVCTHRLRVKGRTGEGPRGRRQRVKEEEDRLCVICHTRLVRDRRIRRRRKRATSAWSVVRLLLSRAFFAGEADNPSLKSSPPA